MYSFSDQLALSTKAYEALQRIKNKSNEKLKTFRKIKVRRVFNISNNFIFRDNSLFKKKTKENGLYSFFKK